MPKPIENKKSGNGLKYTSHGKGGSPTGEYITKLNADGSVTTNEGRTFSATQPQVDKKLRNEVLLWLPLNREAGLDNAWRDETADGIMELFATHTQQVREELIKKAKTFSTGNRVGGYKFVDAVPLDDILTALNKEEK